MIKVEFDNVFAVISPKKGGQTGSYSPESINTGTLLTTGSNTCFPAVLGCQASYIQIIDGAAEVIINEKKYQLKVGNGIVVPANAPYCINAHEKFKIISTVIKSAADE